MIELDLALTHSLTRDQFHLLALATIIQCESRFFYRFRAVLELNAPSVPAPGNAMFRAALLELPKRTNFRTGLATLA